MASLAAISRIPAAPLCLGLAGILPFAVAAAAQYFPVPFLPAATAAAMVIAYGAVVLSFLGGVRWGTAMGHGTLAGTVLSLMPVLTGWIALALPPLLGTSLLLAGFLLQAQRDVMGADRGLLPQWFARLEMLVAAAAALALIGILVRLLI